MALLGIYCDSAMAVDEDEFWLWPDNEDAFQLWLTLQSQWTIGMAGPTGLNYAGVEACMRMQGIRASRQREFFRLIQVMEQAALDEWSSKR